MGRRRKPSGEPPSVALVLGSAVNVWAEITEAQALAAPTGYVAINDMIMHWPGPVTAAVTLHPEKLTDWLNIRAKRGYPAPEKLVIHQGWEAWYQEINLAPELDFEPDIVTDWRFRGQEDSGSSGLFGVKVAVVDLKFTKVICCGIPMSVEGSHFNTPTQPWVGAIRHRRGWEQAEAQIEHNVRSMSGWTRMRYGAPDDIWLTT